MTDAEISDWLLATLRLFGIEEWRAHRVVSIFMESVHNASFTCACKFSKAGEFSEATALDLCGFHAEQARELKKLREERQGYVSQSDPDEVIEECAKMCDRMSGQQFLWIGEASNEEQRHKHGAKSAMAMECAAALRKMKRQSISNGRES